MFFVLSKVVYWLIMPVSMITIVLVMSLLVKSEKAKKNFRIIGISMLLLFTNPLIAKFFMNAWEPDSISYTEIEVPYETCIVLGGYTEPNRPPYDRVHFIKGADRISNAIELYKLGKVKKILISGGSGVMTYKGRAESTTIKNFVIAAGIDSTDILVEDESRNTRENATFSADLLTKHDLKGKSLLITSAFHMPRASLCFDKAGVLHDDFPTDYYGAPIRLIPEDIIVPSIKALKYWSILIKEWIGYIAYKLAGYS